MNILQNILFPHFTFHAPEDMYARMHNQQAYASFAEKQIHFQAGGQVSFDTFFNGVSVQAWKNNCDIGSLKLGLIGTGRFLVRIGVHRIGYASYWLEEKTITLSDEPSYIDVSSWSDIDTGMIYFAMHALESGTLKQGFWATDSAPRHEVKLGIAITHFNRKKQVLPAIARIHDELLTDPAYAGKIQLIVVDNSQNITAEDLGERSQGIQILPNKNLGGSGGFTRGLLHLKEAGGFTHCLFMDDDASCEIDSIKRAYQILAYGKIERLAVAGSLLRELEPYRLFEKGALFDGLCHPLKTGMDMRSINDLLFAEVIDRTPDYGGWWFFAFPIDGVREYAFPFFVRGDDIRFGLSNRFPICTMNGIGCWGEDFAVKSGALPLYLDTRNHLLYALVNNNKKRALQIARHFVMRQLYSYNYASAKAARMAIQHVMKGPAFFTNNMDMSQIRHEIGSFAGAEKLQTIDRQRWHIVYGNPKENRFRRWWRKITLNGFLLPNFMLAPKAHTLFQHKAFQGNLNEIFGFQQVLYEYEPAHMGYVAHHDKEAFFSELYIFIKTLLKLRQEFDTLRQEYLNAIPHLTSEQFWQDVYRD